MEKWTYKIGDTLEWAWVECIIQEVIVKEDWEIYRASPVVILPEYDPKGCIIKIW